MELGNSPIEAANFECSFDYLENGQMKLYSSTKERKRGRTSGNRARAEAKSLDG